MTHAPGVYEYHQSSTLLYQYLAADVILLPSLHVNIPSGHLTAVLLLVTVDCAPEHDGDVPSNTRVFHILMWGYKNGRFRRIICRTNGRFIVPAAWWTITRMLRHGLSLDSSDIYKRSSV